MDIKDIQNMRALAEAILDSESSPEVVIAMFAVNNEMEIHDLLKQMARFMRQRDEEFAEIVKILDTYKSSHTYD